jgi:hypothetical protein
MFIYTIYHYFTTLSRIVQYTYKFYESTPVCQLMQKFKKKNFTV